MIGGAFLCFEGFEKVHQMLAPHDAHANAADAASYKVDASAVEDEKVAGAIRTDFILSAEIMAISRPPSRLLTFSHRQSCCCWSASS